MKDHLLLLALDFGDRYALVPSGEILSPWYGCDIPFNGLEDLADKLQEIYTAIAKADEHHLKRGYPWLRCSSGFHWPQDEKHCVMVQPMDGEHLWRGRVIRGNTWYYYDTLHNLKEQISRAWLEMKIHQGTVIYETGGRLKRCTCYHTRLENSSSGTKEMPWMRLRCWPGGIISHANGHLSKKCWT